MKKGLTKSPSSRKKKPPRRRPWTHKEDQAIHLLVHENGIKQWSLISAKLKSIYTVSTRTGKQCRERWHNHLDPEITKQPWKLPEEFTLFECHKKLGNK